jgi:hypothetical protein
LNKNIAKKEKKRKAERDPIRQKKSLGRKNKRQYTPPQNSKLGFNFSLSLLPLLLLRLLLLLRRGQKKPKLGTRPSLSKGRDPTITFSTFDTHKKAEERNRSRLWKQAAADNRERTD